MPSSSCCITYDIYRAWIIFLAKFAYSFLIVDQVSIFYLSIVPSILWNIYMRVSLIFFPCHLPRISLFCHTIIAIISVNKFTFAFFGYICRITWMGTESAFLGSALSSTSPFIFDETFTWSTITSYFLTTLLHLLTNSLSWSSIFRKYDMALSVRGKEETQLS